MVAHGADEQVRRAVWVPHRRLIETTALVAVIFATAVTEASAGGSDVRDRGSMPLPPARPIVLASPTGTPGTEAYDIPSGELAPALTRWAEISKKRLLAPSDLVRGLRCEALAGAYAPEGALKELLVGTGLDYRYAGTGVVAIVNPQYVQLPAGGGPSGEIALETINIQGERDPGQPPPTGTIGQPPPVFAGGQVASGGRVGFLGNRSVFDTPFTQTNYTDELVRNQQALTVSDIFANNSAVRQNQPPFGLSANTLVRGLPLNSRDIAFDGLYGLVNTYRPTLDGIERVEIFNGPSALLYGFSPSGSAAGVINLIPKRAPGVPITRVTGSYLNDGFGGGAFDVARRFGDGNSFGVRINGAYRSGATPIDRQNEEVGVFTAGLDYRAERLRVSLDLSYQHEDIRAPTAGFTVTPGIRIPRAPSLTSSVQQSWERFTQEQGFGLLRAEYDLFPDTTLFGAIGGSYADYQYPALFPRIQSSAGAVTLSTNPYFAPKDVITGEAGIRTRFETGLIRHEAAIVGTHFDSSERSEYLSGPTFSSNLYAPAIIPRPTLERYAPGRDNYITQLDGIGVTDTMSILDGRIQLIAGGRFQRAQTRYIDPSVPETTTYDKSAATPVAALLFKPWAALTLYASYAEGFGFGPTAPLGAVNARAAFPPVVTSQIETGVKLDLGTVGITVAFYELAQPSGFLNPATNVFGINGEQRNRGMDFNVFGEPVEGVRVLGGVTLLDGVLTRTAGGLYNGNVAPGVPDVQLNLGGEIDLPRWMLPGLTLSGRIIHTSPQYYDQANSQKIPDWTRLDLGMRYRFVVENIPIVARFNVENVTGLNYWGSTGRGQLVLGQPRTFRFSLTADL